MIILEFHDVNNPTPEKQYPWYETQWIDDDGVQHFSGHTDDVTRVINQAVNISHAYPVVWIERKWIAGRSN